MTATVDIAEVGWLHLRNAPYLTQLTNLTSHSVTLLEVLIRLDYFRWNLNDA